MAKRAWGALILLGSLAAASGAEAALITWKLTGSVAGVYSCCATAPAVVNDPVLTSLGVTAGAPFVATVSVDPSAGDGDPGPTIGLHFGAVHAMSFSAGSYSASGAMPGNSLLEVVVTDQALQAQLSTNQGPNDFFASPAFELDAHAHVPGTFPTDAVPVQPPALTNLDPFQPPPTGSYYEFGTSFAVMGGAEQIRSAIGTWVLVPEPSLLSLVAAVGLAFARGGVALRPRLRRQKPRREARRQDAGSGMRCSRWGPAEREANGRSAPPRDRAGPGAAAGRRGW